MHDIVAATVGLMASWALYPPSGRGQTNQAGCIEDQFEPAYLALKPETNTWIAPNLPKDTYVNVMSQYRPVYKSLYYPEISLRLKNQEYKEVVDMARQTGLPTLLRPLDIGLLARRRQRI